MATETCANCGCKFEKATGYEHVTGTSGSLAWTKWFCSQRCIHEYETKKKEEFNAKLEKLGGGNRLKGGLIHDFGIIYWVFAAAIWILKKLIPAMFAGLAAAIAVSGKVLWFLCKILFKVLRFLLKIGFKIFVFTSKVALYIPYLLIGLVYKTMGLLYKKKVKAKQLDDADSVDNDGKLEDEELAEDVEYDGEFEDEELAEDVEYDGELEDEELAEDVENDGKKRKEYNWY